MEAWSQPAPGIPPSFMRSRPRRSLRRRVRAVWPAPPTWALTWTFVEPKQEAGATRQIVVDPNAADSVYAVDADATGLSLVFHSGDGGRTWRKVTLEGAARYLKRLVFDPLSLGTLYALTMERSGSQVTPGIYRSSDDGATWEDIGGLGDLGPLDLLADPAPDGTVYAVTLRGLFKWAPPGG